MDNTTIISIMVALLILFFKSVIKAETSISLIWTGIFCFVFAFLYVFFFQSNTCGQCIKEKEFYLLTFISGFILILIGLIVHATNNKKIKQ